MDWLRREQLPQWPLELRGGLDFVRISIGLPCAGGQHAEDAVAHGAAPLAQQSIADRTPIRCLRGLLDEGAERCTGRMSAQCGRVEELEELRAPALEEQRAIVELDREHVGFGRCSEFCEVIAN